MKKFILLQISLLTFLLFAFSLSAFGQENESVIKQVSLPEKQSLLVVSAITDHKVKFTLDKKEYLQSGALIQLHRKKMDLGATSTNQQIPMWEEFFPSPDKRPRRWIADVYFDVTTQKSYIAVSDSDFFCVKVVDWDASVKRVANNVDVIQERAQILSEKQNIDQLLQPVSSAYHSFYIETLKIAYVDKEIVVHLIGRGGRKRKWVFSTDASTWRETDETEKLDESFGIKQRGKSYFSDDELSASKSLEPFVPSEKRGYWEYSKSRPEVKIEGDGTFVYRRPLPAAATQEEDDAELQRQGKALAYEYKFSVHQVTPEVETFSRVMWKLRVENPTRTPINFAVYDTTFDRAADVMIVLFRLNGVVRSNILRGPDESLLWDDTKLDLTADEISRLTKAHIEGGPDENSVRLILEIKDAPALIFAFQNKKWVKLV